MCKKKKGNSPLSHCILKDMNFAVLRQTAASLDILMTFKIICVVFINALQAHRAM